MSQSTFRLVGNVVPMDGPGFATPTFHNYPANSLWIQDIGENDVVEGFLRVDPPLDQQNMPLDANLEQQAGQTAVYIFYGVSRRYIDTKDGLDAALREEFRKLRDLPYLQRTIGRFIDDESLIAEANRQIDARKAPPTDTDNSNAPIDLSSRWTPKPKFSGGSTRQVATGGGRVLPHARPDEFEHDKPYAATALELLKDDIAYPGWEQSIGQMKSFYVRGATWFHRNFGPSISDLMGVRLDDLGSVRAEFREFLIPGFDWDEPYGNRQAIKGLSIRNRTPLKFTKALQTILLCYCALATRKRRGSEVPAQDVFKHMRIEPANFYIRDFDNDRLAEFARREPKILERLREMTGQRTRVVFSDMVHGHTVTRSLAERTRDALSELFPDESADSLDCRYQPGFTKAASTSEVLEG